MEGHVQNAKGAVRTPSNVLWANQLPHHLPTHHELYVQRNEDALPDRTIHLYGRHSYHHK